MRQLGKLYFNKLNYLEENEFVEVYMIRLKI